MGKLVRRLIPDDIYDVGRNESWFSHMSKKGLHLKKLGRIFIYFEKGEPKEIKYRINIIKEPPSQEQLDIYHARGWDIVTSRSSFYIFSADEKSYTIELHEDKSEQGFSLSVLNKWLKTMPILMLLLALVFGMTFSIYLFNDEPFLYMIEGLFIQQILLIVVKLYVLYSAIRSHVSIRKLKKSLLQGRAINHKKDYKKFRLAENILIGVVLFIGLLAICIPFIKMAKREEYTLPEDNTNLPIIRLAQIEQDPELMRKTSYYDNDVDWENRVSYDWSLLAPIQYEIDERGIIKGEMWEDKSGEYSPSITTRFYKITFDGMAKNIIRDLINRYVYDDDIEIKAVNNLKSDKIKMYIAEEDITKQIFAFLDNRVIYVTYYGKRKIEDIIPLVSEKLLSY